MECNLNPINTKIPYERAATLEREKRSSRKAERRDRRKAERQDRRNAREHRKAEKANKRLRKAERRRRRVGKLLTTQEKDKVAITRGVEHDGVQSKHDAPLYLKVSQVLFWAGYMDSFSVPLLAFSYGRRWFTLTQCRERCATIVTVEESKQTYPSSYALVSYS